MLRSIIICDFFSIISVGSAIPVMIHYFNIIDMMGMDVLIYVIVGVDITYCLLHPLSYYVMADIEMNDEFSKYYEKLSFILVSDFDKDNLYHCMVIYVFYIINFIITIASFILTCISFHDIQGSLAIITLTSFVLLLYIFSFLMIIHSFIKTKDPKNDEETR